MKMQTEKQKLIRAVGRSFSFRVWDGEKMNHLTKGNHLMLSFFSEGIPWGLYDSATEQRYVTGDPNAILNEPGHLMQSTGLKDINGDEIFEGDIIQSSKIQTDDDGTWFVDVRWEDGSFCYGWHGDQLDKRECETEMEIIGNIHQNPELVSALEN